MIAQFLNDPDAVRWLTECRLTDVAIPAAWQGFESFLLIGNEDAPEQVRLYLSQDPFVADPFYQVFFTDDGPVGRECPGDRG